MGVERQRTIGPHPLRSPLRLRNGVGRRAGTQWRTVRRTFVDARGMRTREQGKKGPTTVAGRRSRRSRSSGRPMPIENAGGAAGRNGGKYPTMGLAPCADEISASLDDQSPISRQPESYPPRRANAGASPIAPCPLHDPDSMRANGKETGSIRPSSSRSRNRSRRPATRWSSVEASSGGISPGSGDMADTRCCPHPPLKWASSHSRPPSHPALVIEAEWRKHASGVVPAQPRARPEGQRPIPLRASIILVG